MSNKHFYLPNGTPNIKYCLSACLEMKASEPVNEIYAFSADFSPNVMYACNCLRNIYTADIGPC